MTTVGGAAGNGRSHPPALTDASAPGPSEDGGGANPPGGPGPHPGAPRPLSAAARTFSRLRALRALTGVFGLVFLVYLGWAIWRRSPQVRSAPQTTAAGSEPSDALRSLERFEFTSTHAGKPVYSISADRLLGIEGGIHLLQGIRSVRIARPDGTALEGNAEQGTLTEERPDPSGKLVGNLVLEGDVRLSGTAGERLESDRLEFSQSMQKLVSPGRARFAMKGISGEAGRLVYDLEGKRIHAESGVTLRLAAEGERPDTILQADRADAAADGSSATLRGSVTVVSGADRLSGPELRLLELQDGQVRFSLGAPASGRLASQERPFLLSAERIEGSGARPGSGRTLTLHGAASMAEEEEPGQGPGRRLVADEIDVIEAAGGAGRRLAATGRVSAVLPPRTHSAGEGSDPAPAAGVSAESPAAPPTLTCERLGVVFSRDGSIETGDAVGSVRIRSEGRTATADRAHLVGEERTELRGGRPRVVEGERSLVADEIDVTSRSGQLEARGSVRTHFLAAAGSGTTLFSAAEPVDVASDAARLDKASRTALFTGSVIARQGERALSAASLSVDDARRTSHAAGGVSARTFRIENEDERERPAGEPPTARAAVRIPVRIDAETIDVDESARTVRFDGKPVYREPGRRLAARRITMTGGLGDEMGKGPTETLAEGDVVFEGDGKKGSCDVATYRSAERTIVLEGRDRLATLVEVATGRLWKGPSLTWVLGADSIPTVSGTSGRSKVVGSAPSPGRGAVGKQTDGRAPR